MKYTGTNRILKSETLQNFMNNQKNENYQNFISDWKWILSYTKKHNGEVVLFTFLSILSSTLGVASAYVTSLLINIISSQNIEELSLYIGLTIAIALLTIFSNAIKNRISAKIELDIMRDIQTDLFCNIIDLRWTVLREYKNGDLLNRFNKDLTSVIDNAIGWIPSVIVNVYTFIIIIVLLLRMDPIMAWIGLGSAPALFIMAHYILRNQKEYREKVLKNDSDMMCFESESFYNMDTVKSFGMWDALTERLSVLQNKTRVINMDYNKYQIKTNVALSLFSNVIAYSALGYCLFRLWRGEILFGNMTFFLTQRSSLTSLFNSLAITMPTMLNTSISAHRIREFIGMEKEEHDEQAFQTISETADKGLTIEVNNVTFSYLDSNEEKVYENANFAVHPGEVVAVLGKSGGGKTTLFRMLLGLVTPNKGKVVIKNANGQKVDMNADLRQFISYVPQGNTMMLGTIAENMRIVKKNATDDEIIDALKIACIWEFVEKIGGINAMIGERGKGISEGQAQRMSIARAILRDAPILFLDEATSALDRITERMVLDNVIKASPNKAIVISTHRQSALKKCKCVYHIIDKKIELKGKADEEK